MLNDLKTWQNFGYNTTLLNHGSHKKIILICDYCGKEYEKEYKSYLYSHKTIKKDACYLCRMRKREEISLKLHGVKNASQRLVVRQKISQANKSRLQSDEFKERVVQTNLSRYGSKNAMSSPIIQEKFRATMQKKYGVNSPFESLDIQKAAQQTCLLKYGDKFVMKTGIGKQLSIDGVRQKYGCDNVFQNEQIKEKINATLLKKYGVSHYFQDKARARENNQKGLATRIKNGKVRLYNGKTASEWVKKNGFSKSSFGTLVSQYGFETAIKMQSSISCLEKLMTNWLDDLKIDYISHYRVANKIADIYIPFHNIILETDGLYWHSDAIVDKNYHVNKRQLYLDHGYKPLFFRENELMDATKFRIVQSILLYKLSKTSRFFARKCDIAQIDKEQAKRFFDENHLMGNGGGLSYGLFYENQLVAAIQIRKRFSGYEISRFCNVLNTCVVGGFSKLLNFVRANVINHSSLITFIDLRYGDGSYLTSCGFVYQNTYPSFKWVCSNKVYSRMKFPSLSGYENGCFRLWDCGQAKWSIS